MTRPATSSNRATSASSSPARSTRRRRSPSTCAATATGSTTWPGWSTTPTRRSTPRSARGARAVRAPWTETDAHGTLRLAQVAAYGETVHTFVDRTRYAAGLLEPGYTTERLPNPVQHRPVGLTRIDHVVGNVAQGELADWVSFYADVLGFATMQHFDDDQIRTEYSALDVDGGVGRLEDRDADQRAGRGAEEEPDPGVHRALRRRRRAAPRPVHRRHRRHGRRAARPGRAVHGGARRVLRRGPRSGWPAFDLPWAALQRAEHPRRPRRGRLPAADLHRDRHRPAGGVLRDHPALRGARLRRGQLQGPVRSDRARPGSAGGTCSTCRTTGGSGTCRASGTSPTTSRPPTARPCSPPRS